MKKKIVIIVCIVALNFPITAHKTEDLFSNPYVVAGMGVGFGFCVATCIYSRTTKEINKKISELNSKLEYTSQESNSNVQQRERMKQLEDYKQKLDLIQQEQKALRDNSQKEQQRYETLNAQMTQVKAQNTLFEQSLQALKDKPIETSNDVNILKSRVRCLEEGFVSLRDGDITKIYQTQGVLQDNVQKEQQRYEALEAQMKKLEVTAKELHSQNTLHHQNFQVLKNDVNTVKKYGALLGSYTLKRTQYFTQYMKFFHLKWALRYCSAVKAFKDYRNDLLKKQQILQEASKLFTPLYRKPTEQEIQATLQNYQKNMPAEVE